MYWIAYTFFAVLELVADPLVSWLPLYWEAKVCLVLWLTLYGGSAALYNGVLAQFLTRYEGVIDARVASLQAAASARGAAAMGQAVDAVRGRGTQLAAVGLQWLAQAPGAAAVAAQQAQQQQQQQHVAAVPAPVPAGSGGHND